MMEVIEHVHEAEMLTLQAASLARTRLFLTLPNAGFFRHRIRLGVFGRFPITSIHCHMKEHIRFWTVVDFKEWCAHLRLKLHSVSPQLGASNSRLANWLAARYPNLFALLVIYEIDTMPQEAESLRRPTSTKT